MKNNNLILIKIFIPCVSVCYFMHALIMLMRCFYTTVLDKSLEYLFSERDKINYLLNNDNLSN